MQTHALRTALCRLVDTFHPDPSSTLSPNEQLADAILAHVQAVTPPPADKRPSLLKRIGIFLPIPTLAALLRVAYDLHYITHTTVSDLCRRIARNVMTIGSEEPSYKSLTTAFRNPAPHAYREVVKVCQRIIDYIKNEGLAE